jgi:hypothetical protein
LAFWRIFRQAAGVGLGKSTGSLLGGYQVGTPRVFRGPTRLSPSDPHWGQRLARDFQRCHRVSVRLRWGRDVARSMPTDASAHARTDRCNQLRGWPQEVSGASFWPRGSAGAASGFSSDGGIKVLTATLKRLLPNIEI